METMKENVRRYPYTSPPGYSQAVARRNERERNRVRLVNTGFTTLRQHIPHAAANKKMSKVETLRSAVDYIRQLQALLKEQEREYAAESNSSEYSELPSMSSPTPKTADSLGPVSPVSSVHHNQNSPASSPEPVFIKSEPAVQLANSTMSYYPTPESSPYDVYSTSTDQHQSQFIPSHQQMVHQTNFPMLESQFPVRNDADFWELSSWWSHGNTAPTAAS